MGRIILSNSYLLLCLHIDMEYITSTARNLINSGFVTDLLLLIYLNKLFWLEYFFIKIINLHRVSNRLIQYSLVIYNELYIVHYILIYIKY